MSTTHEDATPSAGYYTIRFRPTVHKRLLTSNNERAFIISQLQDLLGRRAFLEPQTTHQLLAVHIDLLAFSILRHEITLVVFALSRRSARFLAQCIIEGLQAYQDEWGNGHCEISSHTTRLSGPYEALNESVVVHLAHTDWEYDRYSSIGFYLHDRRGDWVHLWRVSRLFDNNPALYRLLLTRKFAPLSRV